MRSVGRPIVRLALSRAEVSVAIGVSVGSVDTMVAEGALPRPRKWHSRKLWLVSEIEAHINDWPSDGEQEDLDLDAELDAFEKKQLAEVPAIPGRTTASPPVSKVVGDYYRQIGFDPGTMPEAEISRLHAEAEARWRAAIPGTPFGKRERDALRRLADKPVNVLLPYRVVSIGIDTSDRLAARGFIQLQVDENDRNRCLGLTLLPAGKEAAQLLECEHVPAQGQPDGSGLMP